SKTKEEHDVHLRLILELLKKEELYAKFSKCDFWLSKGFAVALAILITEASQSRQHDTLVRLPMDIRLKIDFGKSVDVIFVIEGGSGRVVTGVTVGISGIGERTVGSGITKTTTVSIDGDWICGTS
ncbi:hypothetical protein Tco_0723328, partial [Tanacetum coccineum]